MHRSAPKIALSVALVTLVSTAFLTGCRAETETEKLKNEGKTSQQVDGETTWGGGEGPEYTPTPSLPASFPTTDVPLATGTVTDAGERASGVWFANVDVANDAEVEKGLALLEQKGFTVTSKEDTGSGIVVKLNSANFSVTVLTIPGESSITMSYDISVKN